MESIVIPRGIRMPKFVAHLVGTDLVDASLFNWTHRVFSGRASAFVLRGLQTELAKRKGVVLYGLQTELAKRKGWTEVRATGTYLACIWNLVMQGLGYTVQVDEEWPN